MKSTWKKMLAALILSLFVLGMALPVLADEAAPVSVEAAKEEAESRTTSAKAIAAAIAIGLTAGAGALGMAIAIGKAADGIARQPEAQGNIRTTLMLGLVFIETAIIYALIVAILIVFVL